MKKLLALAALIGFNTLSFGQGGMNWNNTSSTLISSSPFGAPMPFRVSPQTTYYLGLFIAPYGTPAPLPGLAGASDPNWQSVAAYAMNSTALSGAGRMANPGLATVTGYSAGSMISFVIRGWHSSAGGADWEAARTSLTPFTYGQSEVGYLILGGGAFPSPSAFGFADGPYNKQVPGFLIGVPEPSSMALLGLGAVACLFYRRRK